MIIYHIINQLFYGCNICRIHNLIIVDQGPIILFYGYYMYRIHDPISVG